MLLRDRQSSTCSWGALKGLGRHTFNSCHACATCYVFDKCVSYDTPSACSFLMMPPNVPLFDSVETAGDSADYRAQLEGKQGICYDIKLQHEVVIFLLPLVDSGTECTNVQ